jgi:hypothetical protein
MPFELPDRSKPHKRGDLLFITISPRLKGHQYELYRSALFGHDAKAVPGLGRVQLLARLRQGIRAGLLRSYWSEALLGHGVICYGSNQPLGRVIPE